MLKYFNMDTRKRMWIILDRTNPDFWRAFLLKCLIVVLVASLQCKAQCSVPPASFIASTQPQSVYSPNYPDSYPEDTSCSWLINSPVDTGRIQLRVVADDFSCCCDNDYLLIKDGANTAARSIAILCSEQNPATITSSGPVIYGEFESDEDGNTGFGYTLQFDYFDMKVSCPTGWISRMGYCYKIYNEPAPWQQAASRCGNDGGFLTSIVDKEENKFLVGSFQGQSSLSWIGMDSFGNWLDGSSSLFYNNFLDESPSTTKCSSIDLNDNGRWTVSDCLSQQLTFICKKTQDGSGGRYWTDVEMGDGGGTSWSTGTIVGVTISVTVFIWMVCCSGKNKDNWLITGLLTCVCNGISNCLGAIGRTLRCLLKCDCFERTRRQNNSIDDRIGSSDIDIDELRHRVSLAEVDISRSSSESSESGNRSRRMSATAQSPPAYGTLSSEPPPPSYVEALDPTFDISNTDMRGSRISLNIGDAIAAPSYESVVGSESHI